MDSEIIAALAACAAAAPGPEALWRELPTDIETLPRFEPAMNRASLDFSADGRWLVGAWSDGFRVFDAATLARVAWVPAPKLESVAFASGENALVAKLGADSETWPFSEIGGWLRFEKPVVNEHEKTVSRAERFLVVPDRENVRIVEATRSAKWQNSRRKIPARCATRPHFRPMENSSRSPSPAAGCGSLPPRHGSRWLNWLRRSRSISTRSPSAPMAAPSRWRARTDMAKCGN